MKKTLLLATLEMLVIDVYPGEGGAQHLYSMALRDLTKQRANQQKLSSPVNSSVATGFSQPRDFHSLASEGYKHSRDASGRLGLSDKEKAKKAAEKLLKFIDEATSESASLSDEGSLADSLAESIDRELEGHTRGVAARLFGRAAEEGTGALAEVVAEIAGLDGAGGEAAKNLVTELAAASTEASVKDLMLSESGKRLARGVAIDMAIAGVGIATEVSTGVDISPFLKLGRSVASSGKGASGGIRDGHRQKRTFSEGFASGELVVSPSANGQITDIKGLEAGFDEKDIKRLYRIARLTKLAKHVPMQAGAGAAKGAAAGAVSEAILGGSDFGASIAISTSIGLLVGTVKGVGRGIKKGNELAGETIDAVLIPHADLEAMSDVEIKALGLNKKQLSLLRKLGRYKRARAHIHDGKEGLKAAVGLQDHQLRHEFNAGVHRALGLETGTVRTAAHDVRLGFRDWRHDARDSARELKGDVKDSARQGLGRIKDSVKNQIHGAHSGSTPIYPMAPPPPQPYLTSAQNQIPKPQQNLSQSHSPGPGAMSHGDSPFAVPQNIPGGYAGQSQIPDYPFRKPEAKSDGGGGVRDSLRRKLRGQQK